MLEFVDFADVQLITNLQKYSLVSTARMIILIKGFSSAYGIVNFATSVFIILCQ